MHSHNHTWLLALSLLIVVFAACAKPGPQQLPPIPPGPFEITGISSECSAEQTPLQVIAWSGAEHAETYLFFRGDQQIAELAVGELQYRDGEKLTPGSVVSYRVRAVNTDGQRDSPAVSYTVPEDQCAAPEEPGDPTDPGQPDDPEDPADPEDPVEPPEEAGALQVAITCTPLASATFNWEPVERADRYDLLQGDTVIAELDAKASQANAVEMIPGLAFEFSLRAYYVRWHMQEAWSSITFQDDDTPDRDQQELDPVAPAERSEAARQKASSRTLPDGSPVHSFKTLLEDLASITRNTCTYPDAKAPFEVTTSPNPQQQKALNLLKNISL